MSTAPPSDSPGSYLDTFTYDYHGRIKSQSRVINGRATTMTVNEFDQLEMYKAIKEMVLFRQGDVVQGNGHEHLLAQRIQSIRVANRLQLLYKWLRQRAKLAPQLAQ